MTDHHYHTIIGALELIGSAKRISTRIDVLFCILVEHGVQSNAMDLRRQLCVKQVNMFFRLTISTQNVD